MADYEAWVPTGKAVASAAEAALRPRVFESNVLCRAVIITIADREVRHSLRLARNKSRATWDITGLHNWKSSKRRK